MGNLNINCAVCGSAVGANSISCPDCGCKYPSCTLFAGEKSFRAWNAHVASFKLERTRKRAHEFRRHNIKLFPSGLCVSGFGSNYTTLYTGNGTPPARLDDVVECSISTRHSVYLKSDGTLYAVGSNADGQCNLGNLKGIKSIYAGANCTYAVDSKGDVIIRGFSPVDDRVATWHNIKKITGSKGRVVGLTESGAVKIADDMQNIELDVSNAVDIDTTYNYTIWLCADGSVGCFAKKSDPRNNVSEWKDIVAVGAENYYAVGLRRDGKVVFAGRTIAGLDMDRSNIANWSDIISIACSNSGILGVKADGTVEIVGNVENRAQIQAEFGKDIGKYL